MTNLYSLQTGPEQRQVFEEANPPKQPYTLRKMRAHPFNSPYMPTHNTPDPNFLDRSRGPLTKEQLVSSQRFHDVRKRWGFFPILSLT